jgi:ubiquinone/menaquinone biosynthesis C-methylase UbiE/uncharacterized protein YbaR (Trm112 family)
MNKELLNILCCPVSGQQLILKNAEYQDDRIFSGALTTENGQYEYPIVNYIPRFVPASNYADNFGIQWNKFRQTQLDSYSGHSISTARFWKATGWSAEKLKGKWVLDIGCGAGRFAEVAVKTGANLVALDYSSAVDACYLNLKEYPNLNIIQGDIYHLPLQKKSFDFVYSLGVLQHTPNVKKAFESLPPMLKKEGEICIDFYEKSVKSLFLPKYWLRPVTKRIPKKRLFSLLEKTTPIMLIISEILRKVPILGNLLKRFVPVANYNGILPLSKKQHKEWALLDTFDWLAPEYDNPQTECAVKKFLTDAKLSNIEVFRSSHLVGKGKKVQ